ncbi:uncharacterized protein LOC125236713 isoform X2 [Leguminivora glycinivorella]|uniref:uncharacterized protein LOC125236713 isoform X1 n=1 Tax=Leguminivora glycinivorella TaxID=1035111 RepID=UPI00200BFBDE|nr:uncharacterized protein LOC125236713 isoform X1 [Leguminivora glycinivorella]XP_047999594.1 uncharacterized protein LOC125236713 isoform X2 [Leguminivora glycinivorella]
MIEQATGLPTAGLEVDGAWWRCKYAPPTFIPLLLTPPTPDEDTARLLRAPGTALLFCYFNNRPAFEEYLQQYTGRVLVIIGPGEGAGVHAEPRPLAGAGAARGRAGRCSRRGRSGPVLILLRFIADADNTSTLDNTIEHKQNINM